MSAKKSTHIQKLVQSLGLPTQIQKAELADSDPTEEQRKQLEFEINYWKQVSTDKQYPSPTAKQYYAYLQANGIVVDAENKEVIRLVCLYFANDPRFEESGGKLHKGLLLRGPVGCGKTTLLRLMASNGRQSFVTHSCLSISDAFSDKITGGPPSLVPHFAMSRTGNVDRYFGQKLLGTAYDDLGFEDIPAIHFAIQMNVMEKILAQRYFKSIPFNATHMTTNLTNDELKTMYGERVYDRMKEMLNIIDFPGTAKSRRK